VGIELNRFVDSVDVVDFIGGFEFARFARDARKRLTNRVTCR